MTALETFSSLFAEIYLCCALAAGQTSIYILALKSKVSTKVKLEPWKHKFPGAE